MIPATQSQTLPPTMDTMVADPEHRGLGRMDFSRSEKMENCEDKELHEMGMEEEGELEINVVNCVRDEHVGVNNDENDRCATEYSSSFEGTCSDSEDELEHDSSNMEVESDWLSRLRGGDDKVPSKKRVTDHWRRFIHPVAWRCRWLELRMKELNKQASKYKRELAVYEQEKQLQPALTSTDNFAARAASLTRRSHLKHLKRRKRKRSELTCDIPSYMKQHAVFSYYEKKPECDLHSVSEGLGVQVENEDNFGVCFEWPMPEVGDDEKSLEQILLDIEFLQSRVVDLTSQLKSIVFNNSEGILSTSAMSVPGEDPHNSPSLSPRCSPVNNGTIHSPCASAFENEEKALPRSAVSSYDDGGHVDIIESTVDLLSSAISRGRHQNLGNEGLDDILINNQVVNEEFHRIEKGNQAGEMPGVSGVTIKEEEDENFDRKVSSSETETDIEIAPIVQQKARQRSDLDVNLRRSKRKRKLRRASSPGSWVGEKKRKRKKSKK